MEEEKSVVACKDFLESILVAQLRIAVSFTPLSLRFFNQGPGYLHGAAVSITTNWCYFSVAGSIENRYTCCEGDLNTVGCAVAKVCTVLSGNVNNHYIAFNSSPSCFCSHCDCSIDDHRHLPTCFQSLTPCDVLG